MSEEPYRITIEGPGVTVSRSVSKELGEQVVVLLLTGAAARVAPLSPGATGGAPMRAAMPETHSIREFIDSVEAKRAPDRIAAFGAYLRTHRGMESFGRADLVQCFEEASERVPKNLSRDIQWALKSGWIAPRTGQRDMYYLTNSGTRAVEEKFSPEVIRKTIGLFSDSRRTGGATDAEDQGKERQD